MPAPQIVSPHRTLCPKHRRTHLNLLRDLGGSSGRRNRALGSSSGNRRRLGKNRCADEGDCERREAGVSLRDAALRRKSWRRTGVEEGECGEGDEGHIDGFLQGGHKMRKSAKPKVERIPSPEGEIGTRRSWEEREAHLEEPVHSQDQVLHEKRAWSAVRDRRARLPLQRDLTHLNVLVQQSALDVRPVRLRGSQRLVLQWVE